MVMLAILGLEVGTPVRAGHSWVCSTDTCIGGVPVRAGDAVHPQPGSYFPAGSAYGLAKIEAAPGIVGFVPCQIYDNARLVHYFEDTFGIRRT